MLQFSSIKWFFRSDFAWPLATNRLRERTMKYVGHENISTQSGHGLLVY